MQVKSVLQNYNVSIHLFRRDLRLTDNTALLSALNESKQVIACFIFDKRQITDNEYFGNNSFEFMINSLNELALQLTKLGGKLYFFEGNIEEIIENIQSKVAINAIYFNRDYTPFSRLRDQKIVTFCTKKQIETKIYSDALLTEPEFVKKSDGTWYTIFSAFRKKAKVIPISKPILNLKHNYYTENIKGEISIAEINSIVSNKYLKVKGGRKEGEELLNRIHSLENYDKARNIPSIQGTSHLSAHLKFGTISIREIYWRICDELSENHTLITELYWRDFFTHIAYHFPRVFNGAFNQRFSKVNWENNTEKFEKWCTGTTGFPIVDAGMRELNTTGYMHNRVRMITASFLTKDLQIDWQKGEKYFAQKLVDYDPSVNNGNWQWSASTGCDAQPWFRIFNPWLQQQKFDPECIYIKRWIPELTAFSAKQIHNIPLSTLSTLNYPPPIVDHKIEATKAKRLYSAQ